MELLHRVSAVRNPYSITENSLWFVGEYIVYPALSALLPTLSVRPRHNMVAGCVSLSIATPSSFRDVDARKEGVTAIAFSGAGVWVFVVDRVEAELQSKIFFRLLLPGRFWGYFCCFFQGGVILLWRGSFPSLWENLVVTLRFVSQDDFKILLYHIARMRV